MPTPSEIRELIEAAAPHCHNLDYPGRCSVCSYVRAPCLVRELGDALLLLLPIVERTAALAVNGQEGSALVDALIRDARAALSPGGALMEGRE